MLYPVILAGGIGKRLWPLSNQSQPKQFRSLINDKTLLQNTYERLLSGFDKKNIFVATSSNIVDSVKGQIEIEDKNIFVEPEAKNTAMAIGFAAVRLLAIDPEAIIVTANSDHYIKQEKKYFDALAKAEKIISDNPEKLLLFGIRPTYPETGYGYIHLESREGSDFDDVVGLKEKPDLETAKGYLESGDYLWSPGIFVFKAKQLLEWYKKHLPDTYQALINISEGKDIAEQYSKVEKISIDYGLLEKLDDMLVLPVDFDWADIGHWRSLRDVLSQNGDNLVLDDKKFAQVDSKNNLLYSYSDKLIATVGVEDMVLVETDKAIFLCPADRAQDVKKILSEMSDKGLDEYL